MGYIPSPSPVQNSDRPHLHPYIHDPVLYISNLPPHVTDDHLVTTFRSCAPFKLNILRDATNSPQPEQTLSGTIQFESIYTAEKALATLHSHPVQGLHPPATLVLTPYPPTSPLTLLPSPTALPRLVRFLPNDLTESELYDLFRPYGALASVRMRIGIGDYSVCGVVEFWHEEDAHLADKAMNRSLVKDQRISMSIYEQGLGEGGGGRIQLDARVTTSMSHVHICDTSLAQHISSSSTDWSGAVNLARTFEQQVCDSFPADSCNLFCENLDLDTGESTLFAHFHQFGRIVSIHVIRDGLGKSYGFGIITFEAPDQAVAAMHGMNGVLLGSKNLVLSCQVSSIPRAGNDASQNKIRIPEDLHDALVQKPQYLDAMDVVEKEGNVPEWARSNRLAGAVNQEVDAGPRLVETPANESVESQTGMPINDISSRSPSDLTGLVTKSDHHPFAKGSYGDIYKGVYRLEDRSIDVAIKTSRMYLQHDQELPKKMKRFRREIIVWQGLKHPNILPFFGTIIDPSTNPEIPAMVCPFAGNGALTTYLCEKDSELTVVKRLSLINDVAHGLQYLHSRQIVHGDLSGSNVLIDYEGKACIADFGLSTLLTRLGGSTFATTRQAKGTMRWMAPEVLDPGDSHDSKTTPTMESDRYSFGSIMLQILTGKIPYHHLTHDAQVIFAIVKGARHARPDIDAVTDCRWDFMEWCWSPVKASRSRPSSDEIAEFAEKELAEIMTTDQKVEPASTSSTAAILSQLPAAEFGPARSSTTGVTLPEDDLMVVEAAGKPIHGADDGPRLIQEQQVGRPPSHMITSLARLPAAEIIELMNTPLLDHLLLPKADPSVVKTTDELINGLLDKPQKVQKQIVGDKLFRAIKSYHVKGSPRVTIALLDQEDLRALAHLADSYPSVLKEKALIVKASLDSSRST